jgi:hypothetical protein
VAGVAQAVYRLGYGFDIEGSGFDSLQGKEMFTLPHRVQTGSDACSAPYIMNIVGCYHGDKTAGA